MRDAETAGSVGGRANDLTRDVSETKFRTRLADALVSIGIFLLIAIWPWSMAFGADWPSKPISLVVGFPAGGSADLVARTIAPELAKRLGQSVVFENIIGAGGTIAAAKVVNANADSYTLLLGTDSEITIAKLVNPALRYDGMKGAD